MKKLVYVILFFSFASLAQNDSLFQEANQAYGDGDYQAAVKDYTQILNSGKTSAALEYNLANAHYKLNHIAPSIYHYERALQLNPSDKDIQNNLIYAQNMAVDTMDSNPENGFKQWENTLINYFSSTGWAWMGIGFLVVFVLFFLGYYFSGKPLYKRIFLVVGIFGLLIAIGSVSLGYLRNDMDQNQSFGIVFSEEVDIKSEPNIQGSTVFELHEGTKIQVLEEYQKWYKIEIANGNQGWISEKAVKKL